MTKRIISLLLCLPMLLSVMAPAVFAAGNDNVIVIDDNITLSNVTIDGDVNDFIYVENSENTEDQPQETEPVATEPVVTEPVVTEPAVTEPAATEPAQPTSEATATTEDGTTVSVAGIPEGASVTVAPSMYGQVSTFSVRETSPETMIFAWDISIQDAEGADWQPEGTVRVELDVPGVKLHKYTEVYVMHIDDEGNESRIEASVTEDGKVAFETPGFSTFAGFTVDFAYEGVEFSIPGETSILLSELFEQLKAPLYIEDVADVVFSDETLVTVTKVEGDWELTSLKAFTTEETLTITMNDGKVYVIDVTDAIPYPTITWRTADNEDGGTNGAEDWTLSTSRKNGSIDNSHHEDYDIIIDGTNATNKTFYIVLQRNSSDTGKTLYLDLHTIWVKGGANLVIRLGGTINNTNTEKIVITQVPGRKNNGDYDDFWMGELFWVEDGSLEIRPEYSDQSNVRIQLDVSADAFGNTTYGGAKALINLRKDADYLKLDQVDFIKCETPAVAVRANELTDFILKDCTFKSGCTSTGNAGAIYVRSNCEDSKAAYVDIHNFELNGCTFDGTSAAGYGGAMSLMGYIHKGLITGCTFNNCKSTAQHGGAIDISGGMGAMTIQNSTFTNCTSYYRGGAVVIRSCKIKNSADQERWTRSNAITVSGCTFTNCDALNSHGGGIAVQGQVYTFTVSDCDFTNCDAMINGGAISIDGQELPDTFAKDTDGATPNWAAAIGCTTCTDYGSTMGGSFNWGTTAAPDITSRINTVNINNGCTFTNCSAIGTLTDGTLSGGNGGSIEFASGLYVTNQATISGATVDGSKAQGEGYAVFWSSCYVKSMSVKDSTFKNCVYTNAASPGPGGTVKSTGNASLVLSVDNCDFLDNQSHSNGGGLYWNASKSVSGLVCKATVNNSRFYRNSAVGYGGGVYSESDIEITKCDIKLNSAYLGGGIAQQVYNNPGARMLEANGVTELKLDPNTWVHENTANLGGGISIRANATKSIADGNPIPYTVRFELNGAAVYKNTATKKADGTCGHGGGIYFISESYTDQVQQDKVDMYTKVILINQGTGTAAAVYDNTAEANGGGIYMESSKNTELRIQGGHISSNEAANGAGIYMTGKEATCYVEGGTIGGEGNDSAGNPLSNVASGNGGGIAISGGAEIQMTKLAGATTGGVVCYNKASGNGGGIWLDQKGTAEDAIGNKITIQDGEIIHNTTTGTYSKGGGICLLEASEAVLNGGTISNNKGNYWGGGVFSEGAKITLGGSEIHDNTGRYSGGGIYAKSGASKGSEVIVNDGKIYKNITSKGWGGGIYLTGSDSTVTINGGEIHENSSTLTGGCGGGINAEGSSSVIIAGGKIYKNTVGGDGGGVQIYNGAKLTVSGGEISENTANAYGGGIAVKKGGTATFKKGDDGSIGTISTNTAKNGGGVYVTGSSKLTFQEGYVISNKAIGTPSDQSTAYQDQTALAGTGGGIFVADGTSSAKSEFSMTGTTDMGIYNNEASFAADDVYANNNNTKVVVPAVTKMNLSQYVGNPISWFEDYATNDTQYDHATALKNGTAMGIKSGYVFRYRKAPGDKRIEVQFEGDQLTLENGYVCMTLGVPTAIDDTVVIDYGLPVKIDVRANDLGMNEDVPTPGVVVAVGPAGGYTNNMSDSLYTGYTGEGSTTKLDVLVEGVKFGIANRVNDSTVCYTPTTMNVDKMATFTYALKYADKYFYANVNVLPATSVYFEDSLTTDGSTNNSNRYITFSGTGEWTQVGTTITDLFQTESNPGDGTKSDHIYGYDSAYDTADMATYSMGSAMKAHVDEGEVASASFTFTGTGFDVISLTNSQTGTILVKVTQNGNVVKTYMVDTYYGYSYKYYKTTFTFTGGKWVPTTVEITKSQMGTSQKQPDGHPNEGDSYVVYSEGWAPTPGSTSLYQIPVIKADLVNYGTYNVEIKVAYSASFDHGQYADKGCDFYLDAIRIYNPMQNDKTANDTYIQDAEGYPVYYELRNMLIDANTFNGLNGTITNGAVFIDKNQSVAFPESIGVADYMNYGPNNEVYLANFQTIAFNLAQAGDVASIQIGVKAPLTTSANDYAWMRYGRSTSDNSKVIYTGTDMYVDITTLNNGVVVIKNNSNSVLSITNIKVTYKSAPAAATPLNIFVDEPSINAVLMSLRREAAAEEKPVLTASGATLSLESEILMNLYFQAENADQISTDDMGLLVWNQDPGTADFATADSVIPGALYDDENSVYMVHTEGIPGKKMGDSLYLAAYAKCADGSYVYTEPMEYSPKIYAMNRLAASQNENLKAMLVAMLNYGAEAQTFFNYNADQLMNADLTAEQKALVEAYEASMMETPAAVDAAKAGTFGTESKGFANVAATMSAEGLFSINYYFTTANAVDQVTMYYWTKDAYDAADVLTAENASGSKVMIATSTENQVFASVDGISAKDLDKTVYVCGVYEVDGETFTTGIITYSLGVYCVNKAANGSEAMKPLAAATAVYSYYAKVYFN